MNRSCWPGLKEVLSPRFSLSYRRAILTVPAARRRLAVHTKRLSGKNLLDFKGFAMTAIERLRCNSGKS